MAKTECLYIRLTKEDKQRVIAAAKRSYLDPSTWARMMIMRSVDEAEVDVEGKAG